MNILTIDGKFNGVDAKFNNQTTLIIVAILGVIAQIVSAWVLHVKP
jgi:Co/Zn/Cd efflux system component